MNMMKDNLNASAAGIRPVGFHLVSSEIRDLTPEEVAGFREIECSMVEREIAERRVKHLREKIDAGLGVTFHWVTAELEGKTLRGNGHHSSVMLSEYEPKDFPQGLKVFREHYTCETPDDFAVLFQQFDDRKSARTTSDVAAVYQGFQEDLINVPHDIAKLAIDGYVFYQRSVEAAINVPIGDLSYALFSDTGLHPFVQWLGELHNSKTKELQKPPGHRRDIRNVFHQRSGGAGLLGSGLPRRRSGRGGFTGAGARPVAARDLRGQFRAARVDQVGNEEPLSRVRLRVECLPRRQADRVHQVRREKERFADPGVKTGLPSHPRGGRTPPACLTLLIPARGSPGSRAVSCPELGQAWLNGVGKRLDLYPGHHPVNAAQPAPA